MIKTRRGGVRTSKRGRFLTQNFMSLLMDVVVRTAKYYGVFSLAWSINMFSTKTKEIISPCLFSFLFIGRQLTTWPENNCLQISVFLKITFCSCVITLLFENDGLVPRAGREWYDIFSWSKDFCLQSIAFSDVHTRHSAYKRGNIQGINTIMKINRDNKQTLKCITIH